MYRKTRIHPPVSFVNMICVRNIAAVTLFTYHNLFTFLFLGSGELEFEEFVTLASRFMVEEDAEAMQQELKEAFRLYDKEGNGYITTGVLREILRELDDKISAEELDMMIEEIDSDGSGTVDFDEFMEVMTGGDD
ncbi:hypothetical protein B5X24_HaOG212151 [Helicoverpa armigera]|nr:hypothetical protein B5X24_HaOG212151 [Helicoverpa armigera]